MRLNEFVKGFLTQPSVSDKDSSTVSPAEVILDLTNNDQYPNTGSFFDHTSNDSLFETTGLSDIVYKQKEKIMKYRQLSMTADVTEALDDIVNEIVFSFDDELPLKIDVNIENEKLVTALNDSFDRLMTIADVKRNLFQIVKRSYIDGQIVMHCAYDKNSTKGGIKTIKMIEPAMLYFDKKDNTYKYMRDQRAMLGSRAPEEIYSIEEIVREDFGLYDGKVNLGYLEYAIKPANMLRTLEDLLVPLRFSRSISRRVFNVDIGDLPNKRGAEVMKEYQRKFRYKKFYNNETGEVSNQQHITSMVEDYWFSNRAGGRGTEVTTIDETGNLGEMNDIVYFYKKLYRALKIPNSRISVDKDADHDWDYETTRTTKDDVKFFMFISRIRQVYSSVFKELLKREIISTGTMKESEWNDKENDISISFSNENQFIEKMNLANFQAKIGIYETAAQYQGKLFSVETILKDVFRFSKDEIEEEFKKIQEEEKNPLYAKFYQNEDESGSKW